MSKAAVVADVARRLLAVPVGEQIPTTAQLSADLGVGYGTVHGALRALQADRAVTLSTHGHRGTRLLDRDLIALWQAGDLGAMVGTLPLPQSLEFAGLATALSTVADKVGMRLELTFRQGSEQRFGLLRQRRADWVLSSAAAAARERSCSAIVLPENTYYSKDSVVVITAVGRAPNSRGRVAVDRHSYDHTALTLAEFPDADLVGASYWWIPDMIVHDEIDAAIWHRTSTSDLLTATGLSVHMLSGAPRAMSSEMSAAALVHRQDDVAVRELLTGIFDPAALTDLQQQVMSRRLAPAY